MGSKFAHVAFEHDGAIYELNPDRKITGWYSEAVLHAVRPPKETWEVRGQVDVGFLESVFSDRIPVFRAFLWYLGWRVGYKSPNRPTTCLSNVARLLKECRVDVGAPDTPQELITALIKAGGHRIAKDRRPIRDEGSD